MPVTAASRYRRYRSAIQMHPDDYHRDDSPECADVDVHATDYVTDGLDECGYRDTPRIMAVLRERGLLPKATARTFAPPATLRGWRPA